MSKKLFFQRSVIVHVIVRNLNSKLIKIHNDFFFYIGESLFPLTFLFSVCLQTPVGSKNRFYSGFPQIESCPSWRCSSVPSGNRCYWIWVCRQRCCFDAGPITASVLRRRRSLGWCGGGGLKGSERQWRGYCRVCRALASIQRSWRTF